MKTNPFTIVIDSAEQYPWPFRGIKDDKGNHLVVPTKWESLGRHPNGLGDYTIDGYQGVVHVERKSKEDFQGTVLGFNDGRRERFEKELDNLGKIKHAIVIVEASRGECIFNPPDYGMKTKQVQAKILMRSIIAFEQDYRIPFAFLGERRLAEKYCFRYFERFWRHRDA